MDAESARDTCELPEAAREIVAINRVDALLPSHNRTFATADPVVSVIDHPAIAPISGIFAFVPDPAVSSAGDSSAPCCTTI